MLVEEYADISLALRSNSAKIILGNLLLFNSFTKIPIRLIFSRILAFIVYFGLNID